MASVQIKGKPVHPKPSKPGRTVQLKQNDFVQEFKVMQMQERRNTLNRTAMNSTHEQRFNMGT